jgi:hypothetical protein
MRHTGVPFAVEQMEPSRQSAFDLHGGSVEASTEGPAQTSIGGWH